MTRRLARAMADREMSDPSVRGRELPHRFSVTGPAIVIECAGEEFGSIEGGAVYCRTWHVDEARMS